jgi:hypothetical protein
VLLPNFPLLMIEADFTTGPPGVPGPDAVSLNSGTLAVTELIWGRGRQYELGYAQAGTARLRVNDPGELLSPANGASPFNTGGNTLLPYRAFRVSALWPLTGNIVNPDVDPAFDPGFEGGTTGGWTSPNGATTLTNSTAQAWQGTRSLRVAQAGAGAANGAVLAGLPCDPGAEIVASVYVYIPAAPAGTTVQLQLSDGTTTAVSAVASTTGVWQRLTAAYTATGATQTLTLIGAGNATPTYHVDGVQVELATTAGTWTAGGPTLYRLHTGYIERYPQEWRDQGMWGLRPLETVDALAMLSQTVIRQSYASAVLADGPSVVLPYDDQSAPQRVVRPDGGTTAVGYWHAGNSQGSVQYAGNSWLDGTPTIAVVQQNADPAVSANSAFITYAGTRGGAMSISPQAFTLEVWVQFTSGTVFFGAGSVPPGENVDTAATGPAYRVGWATSAGRLVLTYNDPNGGSMPAFGIGDNAAYNGYPDLRWHYLAIRFPGGSTVQSMVDGVVGGQPSMGFTPSAGVALTNFYLDATTYFGDPISQMSAAWMAAYPYALTEAQLRAHYRRGIGYREELTGTRAERLLAQYWAAPVDVTGPGTVPMSPDHDYDGRTMLDVLTEISSTEGGLTYARGDGTVTVEDRDHRYRQQTAQWVFGERQDLGEYPYTDLAYDYDPTYVYSEAQVDRPGGPVYSTVDPAALDAYGQRIFSKTLYTSQDWYAQQASLAYATRYGTPRLRVQTIELDPASNPALWPVVLGVEVSQRVTVRRRTAAGVTIAGDFHIERVDHAVTGGDSWSWRTTLQLSPVFVPTAWILGDSTYGVLGSTTVCVY